LFESEGRVRTLFVKVGDPRDPHTVIGPLIRASQSPFIAERIESSKASGARVLCGTSLPGGAFLSRE
jgi:aldehyde dehydrogenase (NAD+)